MQSLQDRPRLFLPQPLSCGRIEPLVAGCPLAPIQLPDERRRPRARDRTGLRFDESQLRCRFEPTPRKENLKHHCGKAAQCYSILRTSWIAALFEINSSTKKQCFTIARRPPLLSRWIRPSRLSRLLVLQSLWMQYVVKLRDGPSVSLTINTPPSSRNWRSVAAFFSVV
jgi:hypothetical protein